MLLGPGEFVALYSYVASPINAPNPDGETTTQSGNEEFTSGLLTNTSDTASDSARYSQHPRRSQGNRQRTVCTSE